MDDGGVERRLTTILAADVVGYSRLMAIDETGTLASLKAIRRELIEPKAAEHHGRIVKLIGDGTLMEFGSVVDAIRFAVDVQAALTTRNATALEDQRITYRIGVNIGDIIVEGDDIYGDGVNIAARLEALAEPGGICVSRTVFEHVKGKVEVGFQDLGVQKVKNIPEPVQTFKVLLESRATGPDTRVASAPGRRPRRLIVAAGIVALASFSGALVWFQPWEQRLEPLLAENVPLLSHEGPSIAVLPFTNMSDDPAQEYFVDGMTEDLITDLAKIESLFVIARNTVFTYKGKSVAVPEVARQLGVRYVLEGSARRVGDRVRINAQLIDGTTGTHIWAERYDGGLDDIFALQDKVMNAIVAKLEITVAPGTTDRRESGGTTDPNAHDAYLRGWQLYRRYTPEDFAKAIPHLERAVELDPNYGQAWAALASIYWITHGKGEAWSLIVNPDPSNLVSWMGTRDKAEISLRRAMRNPTPLAHQVESQISFDHRQFDRSIGEAEKAIVLNQNDPAGHLAMAWALIVAGRAEEAISPTETAMRLDPNFPGSALFALGTAQLMLKRYDEAQATLKRALAFTPENFGILVPLSIAYAKTGQRDEAEAALKKHHSFSIFAEPKIENYLPWWPFRREADTRLFGSGLIEAGLCCEQQFEEYIANLRRGGTLE